MEVLGEPGRGKVFAGGTAGKQHALAREISSGPGLTELGTSAYTPQGEVAGGAGREVGVTDGAQEPGQKKTLGDRSSVGRRDGDLSQKAACTASRTPSIPAPQWSLDPSHVRETAAAHVIFVGRILTHGVEGVKHRELAASKNTV
jgi:hypothetical protein